MGDKGKDKATCEESQIRLQFEGILCGADSHTTMTDLWKASKFPGKQHQARTVVMQCNHKIAMPTQPALQSIGSDSLPGSCWLLLES